MAERALFLASSMESNLAGVDIARDFGLDFFGVPSTPFVEVENDGILSLKIRSTYRTKYSVTTA